MRPVKADDATALLALFGQAKVVRYMDLDQLHSLVDAEAMVTEILQGYRSGSMLQFGLALGEPLIGTVTLADVDNSSGQADVGYAISPEFAGRGYATKGLRMLSDFAIHVLNLRQLCAVVDAGNPASARVLSKAGFLEQNDPSGTQAHWILHA